MNDSGRCHQRLRQCTVQRRIALRPPPTFANARLADRLPSNIDGQFQLSPMRQCFHIIRSLPRHRQTRLPHEGGVERISQSAANTARNASIAQPDAMLITTINHAAPVFARLARMADARREGQVARHIGDVRLPGIGQYASACSRPSSIKAPPPMPPRRFEENGAARPASVVPRVIARASAVMSTGRRGRSAPMSNSGSLFHSGRSRQLGSMTSGDADAEAVVSWR